MQRRAFARRLRRIGGGGDSASKEAWPKASAAFLLKPGDLKKTRTL